MSFDQGLTAFRYPDEQFEAIKEISTLDEGRIFILKQQSHIIGYVTFHYPDPLERWSTGELEYLIELGAIEISLPYRKLHLGKELIQTSLASDEIEDYIILTTEYYWHWDLKNSGLDVYEYKKLMQKLMGYGNLEIFATDDPEITSHPANCLMARIGSRITIDQLQAFDDIRFMNRFFF
ncbi:acetoin utilization protein [Staphylococcus arlettae CVD059]|nr:GNAT family N-acetyltransferase [Staphylococcus arlettae]EJY95446.1 acetoin utilization protein [Staphylococcus arlettae CVD059]